MLIKAGVPLERLFAFDLNLIDFKHLLKSSLSIASELV